MDKLKFPTNYMLQICQKSAVGGSIPVLIESFLMLYIRVLLVLQPNSIPHVCIEMDAKNIY